MKKLYWILLTTFIFPVYAGNETFNVKRLKFDFALQIAKKALQVCRKMGYQTSVVIVDRTGNTQVVLRDDLAARFTIELAESKANLSAFSGQPSGEMRKIQKDILQELNHVKGILLIQGGLPIRSGGSVLGGIGISGAAGGDKDELCAKKALEWAHEKLEFAD